MDKCGKPRFLTTNTTAHRTFSPAKHFDSFLKSIKINPQKVDNSVETRWISVEKYPFCPHAFPECPYVIHQALLDAMQKTS